MPKTCPPHLEDAYHALSTWLSETEEDCTHFGRAEEAELVARVKKDLCCLWAWTDGMTAALWLPWNPKRPTS